MTQAEKDLLIAAYKAGNASFSLSALQKLREATHSKLNKAQTEALFSRMLPVVTRAQVMTWVGVKPAPRAPTADSAVTVDFNGSL